MTTVAYKYQNIETYRQVIGSCNPVSTWNTYSMETTWDNSLPPQHRALPTNLLDSLTGQAKQFTEVHYARIEAKHESGWGLRCNGFKTYYTIDRRVVYTAPTMSIPDLSIDWMTAMRNKIQDDKISFAESIGEWRESVKLFEEGTDILKRAGKFAKRIWRNRKNRRAMAYQFKALFSRDPENKYELFDFVKVDLALKFGFKPNADLLYDSVQQLSRVVARKRRIQVTVPKEQTYTQNGSVSGSIVVKRKSSIRAIAYVEYDVDDYDFTSGNLAEALWAGIPVSFMVDWFYSVGSYLSSFNAMKGVKSLKGTITIKDRWTGEDRRVITSGCTLHTQGRWIYRSHERRLFYDLPYGDLPSLRVPDTDLWERLWSSVEVLLSIRKGTNHV